MNTRTDVIGDSTIEMRSASVVDVSSLLDNARFGPVQLLVLGFMFVTLVMDGFDIQAIAFAAPALTDNWGISRAALGPVLAAALVGMAIGAAGVGSIGDRLGRKTALVVSCIMMAVGSIASAFAAGPVELAAYRFITGIGLGGAMPNGTALMYEFAPKKWRHVATSVALIGVPLGGMLGAALARTLIPQFGWQAPFVVGGVVPGLLAALMWFLLPESPRFLSTKPRRRSELASLLRRIDGARHDHSDVSFVSGGGVESGKSVVSALFAPQQVRDTLTLWLIFFTNVFSVYFFFSWLPIVLSSANLDFQIAVTGSLYFNLGGVIATLASSTIIGRFGSRKVLTAAGFGAVISVLAIAANQALSPDALNADATSLMWTMAAAGGCMNALQIGMFSVAAHAYPTYCRSTGVGWSLAVARFGGIISSFAGSAFFALGMQARDFFLFIAAMLTFTFIGVFVLRRHIPAMHADQYSVDH